MGRGLYYVHKYPQLRAKLRNNGGCDLTDFIISQRQMFQTVIQRQVAAIGLRTLAMNPNVRVNRNQSNASRTDILYELDGNTSGVRPGGLGYDLKKAYEALRLERKD